MNFKTLQEDFWVGSFGDDYINRNQDKNLIESKANFFSRILKSAPDVKSIVELGCNMGLNLSALNTLNRAYKLCGYEINSKAVQKAEELKIAKIINQTILEQLSTNVKYDMSFTKGVLIHINPEYLHYVYDNLYNLSTKYICICEYYNPSPVAIEYRGNKDKLFKRDFAGEMMDRHNLKLVDYGFVWRRDNLFPQDDISWFLLEK